MKAISLTLSSMTCSTICSAIYSKVCSTIGSIICSTASPVIYSVISLWLLFSMPALANEYRWLEEAGKVALLSTDKTQNNERIVWAFNYGKGVTKPYFHPITLTDNTVITRFKPKSKEHPWHKGLWFSFKTINGVNYWEENRKTRDNGGLSLVVDSNIQTHQNHSATILLTMTYQQRDGKKMVLEKRTMNISSPDKQGNFVVDWYSTFTALQNIELGRTPLPGEKDGKGHGGYAGFSFRVAEALRNQWLYLASEQSNKNQMVSNKAIHRSQQNWVYSGGKQGGVALFDHPTNSKEQTYWYVGGQHYFSPAFLHQANQHYKQGESWQLTYRMSVYNQPASYQHLNKDYVTYTSH